MYMAVSKQRITYSCTNKIQTFHAGGFDTDGKGIASIDVEYTDDTKKESKAYSPIIYFLLTFRTRYDLSQRLNE